MYLRAKYQMAEYIPNTTLQFCRLKLWATFVDLHVCSAYVDSKDGAVIFFVSTFSWFKTKLVYKNIMQQLELSQTPKELGKKERTIFFFSGCMLMAIVLNISLWNKHHILHSTRKHDAERRRLTSTWREILSTCSVYCGKAWTIFCKSRVDSSLPSLDTIKFQLQVSVQSLHGEIKGTKKKTFDPRYFPPHFGLNPS